MTVLALILSSKSGIWFTFTKEGLHALSPSQYLSRRKDEEKFLRIFKSEQKTQATKKTTPCGEKSV